MAGFGKALLDFIWRRTKTPITQPSGTTGVASYAGKLVSFETDPDLQGTNLYRTFANTIANTTIVGAGIRYYQNLLAGTAWTITPKEGTGSDGEAACELVKTGLFEADLTSPWSTVIKRAALYRMYGFSLHEWTMRKRASDGAWIYADISHRPQHTIYFWDIPDKGGPFVGVVQRPILWGEYFYIPRERLFYTVDSSLTDSPDGVGVLRHVVEHTRRLARYEQLEGWGYENDLRGIPVGKIPYAALKKFAAANNLGQAWIDQQTNAVETLVQQHVRNPNLGITIDSSPYQTDTAQPTISSVPQWAIELLTARGEGLADLGEVIERINREIARVLGMEFMLLGGDGKGSLALSTDKTSMFASVLEAVLHELVWFVQHDLVYPLLRLNGYDPDVMCPDIQPDPIATERIEVCVDALAKLAQAGALLSPDDPAINQIRQRLHIADQPKLPPELVSSALAQRAGVNQGGSDEDEEPGEANLGAKDTPSKNPPKMKDDDGTLGKRRSSFRRPRR